MNYYIRPIQPTETPLLKDFLYEAIFIPEGVAAPPRSIFEADALTPDIPISRAGRRVPVALNHRPPHPAIRCA